MLYRVARGKRGRDTYVCACALRVVFGHSSPVRLHPSLHPWYLRQKLWASNKMNIDPDLLDDDLSSAMGTETLLARGRL